MPADMGKRAAKLMSDTIVWDNHGCLPLRPGDNRFLPELRRYRDAGVTAVGINIGFGELSIERHIRVCATFRDFIRHNSKDFLLVKTAQDVARAKAEGRLGVFFDIEGCRAIGDELSLIGLYYDLGVRWMLIAYNTANRAGCGVHDEFDTGLTEFGRRVVREMERVGMVVCCSHTGYKTARDVMEMARNPVIFSHSNPRALCDHPRNIPDDLMSLCAQTGGVVGINGIGPFLGDNDNSTEALVRMIDYAVGRIGPRHVGLGLDFVFDRQELEEVLAHRKTDFPEGMGYDAGMKMVEPERIPDICEALLRLGYRDDDVRAILGANFLRVAQAVWRDGESAADAW